MLNIKNKFFLSARLTAGFSAGFSAVFSMSMGVVCCALLLFLAGCRDDHQPGGTTETRGRTVISYMVADNSLFSDLERNINMMEAGWNDRLDGTLLVFIYPPSGSALFDGKPSLLKIVHDTDPDVIKSKVVKTFDRADPCRPDMVKRVLTEAIAYAPADGYGVIFASHALGWLPQNYIEAFYSSSSPIPLPDLSPSASTYSSPHGVVSPYQAGMPRPGMPLTRTFGSTYSYRESELEIYDLAAAGMPDDVKFDFILFDACLSSCVETAYELRNKCEYFIASSAEVLAAGFPYNKIVPDMFGPKENFSRIAENYFSFYNGQKNSLARSATIAVVATDKLPALAVATRDIVASGGGSDAILSKPSSEPIYFYTGNFITPLFYDFKDYIIKIWGSHASTASVEAFNSALNEAVVYQAATATFFDFPIRAHCGLTSYAPSASFGTKRSTAGTITSQTYCNHYSWSRDSGLGAVVLAL